jgi:hypothetical protein
LIGISDGICKVPPNLDCIVEAGGHRKREVRNIEPLQKRNDKREEVISHDIAQEICQAYINASSEIAARLGLTVDEDINENILISCMFDTETTGDRTVSRHYI